MGLSLALSAPASGTARVASLADAARSQARLSAPAFAQVPAAPDKGLALKAQRAASAIAAAEHDRHVLHVAHLRAVAARAAAARAAAAAAAWAKAHPAPARVVSAPSAPSAPAAPVSAPSASGHYSCGMLEQLWTSAGGSSGAAFTAAEIATAESGGNPGAISPTSDYGLWQINSSNAPGSEMLSPSANVREAIALSGNGSNWSPWTTWTSGAYQGQCGSGGAVLARIVKPGPPPAPHASSLEVRAMRAALTRVGDPYSWGAAGPGAFDCSGLVVWAYAQEGRYEPHFTGDLWNEGYHVSSLQPGDLVFFYSGHSHVGIYLGNGQMVDAPHTGSWVKVQAVDWANYSGAVRL